MKNEKLMGRIAKDPEIMAGKPTIKGTGITWRRLPKGLRMAGQ